MPLCQAASEVQFTKWQNFFENDFAPWDASQVSSQLKRFVESQGDNVGIRCIELGCGSGACTRWLASTQREAVGLDLIAGSVQKARSIATVEGSSASFMEADVFELPASLLGAFDFVYDSQCFHCLREHDEAAAVEAIASLIVTGGKLMVLTGNDREPEVGPSVLSQQELEGAFVGSGLFELVEIQEGRFDLTPGYAGLPVCPLCWVAIFRKL